MKRQRKGAVETKGSWGERIGWLLVIMYLWSVVLYIIFRVDPLVVKDIGIKNIYLPLLVIVLVTVWVTVGRWRHSLVKGLVWAVAITVFLLLRFLGLGHWANLLLIAGLLASCEYYWRATGTKIEDE